MTDFIPSRPAHGRATPHWRRAALTLGLLFAAATATLWSWNVAAVALLGAPEARFIHALAPLVAVVLLVALVRSVWTAGTRA